MGDLSSGIWAVQGPYAEIANAAQNALTNSPLNEGKKAFVKMLAGNYDEAATKAKLLRSSFRRSLY